MFILSFSKLLIKESVSTSNYSLDRPSTASTTNKKNSSHFLTVLYSDHITRQKWNATLIPFVKMSCRSSSRWNKAKRFQKYVALHYCNNTKLRNFLKLWHL